MRKGFDGLSGLVREGLLKDPLSGDVFIFFNKRRTHVKLLLWERDGFSLYHKRLERGTYELPSTASTWPNTTIWAFPGGAVHAWTVVFTNEKFYAIDANLVIVNRLYEKTSLAKVYRKDQRNIPDRGLYPEYIDVTNQYRKTSDIRIELVPQVDHVNLSVFSRIQGWTTVMMGTKMNEKELVFTSVGRDVVYGISNPKNAMKLHAFPFYLDVAGKIHWLKPDYEKRITAKLIRKWPPYLVRNMFKIEWNRSLNGSEIQAANSQDFSD